MFTTTITISNPSTTASSFEAFSTLYCEFIGAEAELELNYIRSDSIIDGLMKSECFKGWDNDAKTATFIHYHDSMENMRDYQLKLTENSLSVEAQQKLHDAGWTVAVSPGTAEDTSGANKIHDINEWALETIRPERRQEVLDNIIENNG